MTRDEYLGQLSKYLKKLPKADYDDAMEAMFLTRG